MGYIYVPLRALEPLSPHNFARIAVYRNIYDGPTDPVERAEEALAAFQQEFSFTGDIQKASEIYMSFYKNVPPSDKPVRPGPVSLQEISQGQHVSGEQFFQALRA